MSGNRPVVGRLYTPGMFFRLLWAFDLFVAAVVLFFFVWGLADGSVSSFNIALWLGLLRLVGGVVVGGRTLQRAGHTLGATLLLLVLAIPGLGFSFFLLMVLILQPRWN
jgi:multisubunit Na+/H+ antiporter MnhF subunit